MFELQHILDTLRHACGRLCLDTLKEDTDQDLAFPLYVLDLC